MNCVQCGLPIMQGSVGYVGTMCLCRRKANRIEDLPANPVKHTAEIESLRQQLAEANNERAWIRRKLKLPEDTKLLSGEVTLAGTMHNVCNGNHGYRAYIESEKCDDKAGKIARLTVQLAECQAREISLSRTIGDIKNHPHKTNWIIDWCNEALALPNAAAIANCNNKEK